jgi:hypothetical protein
MSLTVPLYGFGSGGAALNFKIVPGLTQPGTASENTIWVKTEKIGTWSFSADQPENMQEWDVWFPTGTVSLVPFNALRKNALQVYPRSARQMVGGVLTEVTAMTYQHGSWLDWKLWLYNRGTEKYPLRLTVQYYTTASYVKNADSITVTLKKVGSSSRVHGVYIENPEKIDLTPYTVMKCVASRSAAVGNVLLGVTNGTAAGGDLNSGMIAQNTMAWESIGTDHICTLDVSAINEMAYPVVRIYAQGNTTIESNITFKEWWLE